MADPIPNCPQPDTEIRERAWTAEQEKSAETQALIVEAYLDWDEAREGVCTNLECFKAGAAYAATLRQQADRGDGAVSDGWDGEAYANMAGELESWKRRALQAEHFIEHEVQGQTFMGEPLLRAPAEQGGMVDLERWGLPDSKQPAQRMDDGYWTPWHIAQEALQATLAQNTPTVPSDLLPRLKVACRALVRERGKLYVEDVETLADVTKLLESMVQNAQGEEAPAAYCCPDDPYNSTAFAWPGTSRVMSRHKVPLYLHAERARVPEITDVLAHWVIASVGDVPYATMTTEQVKAALRENLHLLAAPSQPEDAVGKWSNQQAGETHRRHLDGPFVKPEDAA